MSNNSKSIKIVNNTPRINTFDMIQLHSIGQEVIDGVYSNENAGSISSLDGIKIYIKAVERLKELFLESRKLAALYVQFKSSNKEEAGKNHLELTNVILKIKEILDVFINGLAVVHDENAKDFMMLLYNRFSFLKDNADLFYLTQNMKYMSEVDTMLNRLQETFAKMLEILKQSSGQEVQSSITNAELSV